MIAGVRRFGRTAALKAAQVEHVTERLRVYVDGKGIENADEDFPGPPSGTLDYEGRALAFIFQDGPRSYRVLVEDITIDE